MTSVSRKAVLIVLDILIILLLAGFFFSLLYLINGSLEAFPTGEQQGKARIAAVIMALATGLPCAACVFFRIKGSKK